MRLVFLGLSLSSSWGNGHATTYRALLKALHANGHELLFLEREQPWYAAHRDLSAPSFCALRFYEGVSDLDRFGREIADADAVVVGSYVPDGIAAIDSVTVHAPRLAFYDIDTPVTMRALRAGGAEYLAPRQVPRFDLYLSFTGGPALRGLERRWGARCARPLYCAVDPAQHYPIATPHRWKLGYIGTYSRDRQPALERLLIEPARRMPDQHFVVAGPLYPSDIDWPENVDRIDHLSPDDHSRFYSSLEWTLNITRADMVRTGYSPSVRLFEASACGVPIISDKWPGLARFFEHGREILVAETAADVIAALRSPPEQRKSIARAARIRTLAQHTAAIRARELEAYLLQASAELAAD
jgi:spore maturation protein CgeB